MTIREAKIIAARSDYEFKGLIADHMVARARYIRACLAQRSKGR